MSDTEQEVTVTGPMPIPVFIGSSFSIAMSPTNNLLTVGAMQPVLTSDGGGGAVLSPVCALHLSHHAVAELARILALQVKAIEEDHGKISTPFLTENPLI